MAKHHVLICGAGFGGLELSTLLSAQLSTQVHVTVIDRSDSFVFGFSKLDLMFGRATRDQVRLSYSGIAKDGVEFRQETITSIDPLTRRVTTDAGTYEPDVLVIALGADYDPGFTPGFTQFGHEYYSVDGAQRMRQVVSGLDHGRVVIAILSTPFKCPPAPFEAALLLHETLVERGVRDKVDIQMISPMPSPIPVSPQASQAIVAALEQRAIGIWFGRSVLRLGAETIELDAGEPLPYDTFIGIPRHRVPDVVEQSGLTAGGDDGWVHVDPRTLQTPYAGVFAIGDVADTPVPRAGVFAERGAATVAAAIGAALRGSAQQPFDGKGTCYIEFGGGQVGKVETDFMSGPKPLAPFIAPSTALATEKDEFAASRRARWFGV